MIFVEGIDHMFEKTFCVSLKIPQKEINDRKYIRSIGSKVMKMQFEVEKMPLDMRDSYIMNKLNIMEQNIKS